MVVPKAFIFCGFIDFFESFLQSRDVKGTHPILLDFVHGLPAHT
jgi:hypothetical protein